jgi:hypothetical protein
MAKADFWKYVNKTNGCWLWTGKKKAGYGILKRKGVDIRAHRFSWEQVHGEIPDNLCILHKCDVRNCVKPDHLFLGTRKDNSEDMRKKSRHSHGPEHSVRCSDGAQKGDVHWRRRNPTKLTLEDVRKIRMLLDNGVTQKGVAQMFNVKPCTISNIKAGRIWGTRTLVTHHQ